MFLAGSSNGVRHKNLTVNDPQVNNGAYSGHDGNLQENGDQGPMDMLRPLFSDANSQQHSAPSHNAFQIDPDLQDPVSE